MATVGKGAQEGGEKAAKLINDLQDISLEKIVLIVVCTWLAILLARKVLPYLAERGPNQLRLYLLGAVPIIRLVLLSGAILWLIPIIFNVTFQNFLVMAGAASVAIGFAFKDYASSLIAGIVGIFERPYRPGDWVEIDGDYGEVCAVGMRAIKLRTPADDIVTVPHSRMWEENISNSNDGTQTLMCIAEFFVEPRHDAASLRAALHDVGLTSAYLEYDKPVVVMVDVVPLGTRYRIKAYPFDMRDQFQFRSDLSVRGKACLREMGVTEVTAAVGEFTDKTPAK